MQAKKILSLLLKSLALAKLIERCPQVCNSEAGESGDEASSSRHHIVPIFEFWLDHFLNHSLLQFPHVQNKGDSRKSSENNNRHSWGTYGMPATCVVLDQQTLQLSQQLSGADTAETSMSSRSNPSEREHLSSTLCPRHCHVPFPTLS